MTNNLQAKYHIFLLLMPLYSETILFQHQHIPYLMRPSLKLSGLLKDTNVTVSRPVRTGVVKKFTGITAIGI